MKKKYKFDDGTINEVEIEKELYEFIKEDELHNENYERKNRYWCPIRLDQSEYEGNWFKDNNTPQSLYEYKESQKRVDEFKKKLTPIQKRRLEIRMENPGISYRKIAEIEGTDIKTIRECFESIKKKYKNFFTNTPSK